MHKILPKCRIFSSLFKVVLVSIISLILNQKTSFADFDVSWTNAVGVSVNGNSLTKTGTNGTWNSGASSIATFGGNGGVDFTVMQSNVSVICGLSDADTDQSIGSIDYGILASGGILSIYDNGAQNNLGTYQPGARFRIERIGTTVYFKQNGTTIYVSAIPSTGNLLVDTSLYTTGAVISDVVVTGVTPGVASTITDSVASSSASAEVQLTWSVPANNGGAITRYEVQYGTVASGQFGSTFIDDATAGATITGLTNGTQYQFRVVALNSYGYSAPSNIQSAFASAPFDVTWTNAVGVTVNGSSLTKTLADGWGNAGAASIGTFGSNGGVEFGFTQTNIYAMAGLSAADQNQDYASIGYAVYAQNGIITIYENGAPRGNFGAYLATDRFRVERIGSTIYYKKNGVVFYTSAIASTGLLLGDTSIYSQGGIISSVKFTGFAPGAPNSITDLNGVGNANAVALVWSAPTVNNGAAITGYTVQYGTVASGAFASTFNDDATPGATISGLTNGTAYQFRVLSTNQYGTSTASNVVTATPSAPVNVTWTNAVGVTVTGNSITKNYPTGWNSGASSVESFGGNGGVDVNFTQTNQLIMVGLAQTDQDQDYNPIDYALYATTGTIAVYEKGNNMGSFGSYQTTDRFSVERGGSTIYYKKNGTVFYTSTVASTGKLIVDSSIYTSGGIVSDAKIVGVSLGAPDAIPDLTASQGLTSTEVQLNWSAPANNASGITGYQVQYGTVASGQFASTFNDDAVPGATITGLSAGTAYQFRVISTNAFGTSTVSNVVTATPNAPLNVTWANPVGVSVNSNSITKTASPSDWGNAGAVSAATFGGNGGVDYTVVDTTTHMMCALSHVNTGLNFGSLDYALYTAGGTIRVMESNVLKVVVGPYSIGDRLRVERIGTKVYYKRNGIVFYTSTVPSSGLLMVDASLMSTGAVISDARIIGIQPGPPNAVTDLVSFAGDNSGEIKLSWSAPGNNGAAITSYQIQYGTIASGAFASTFNDDAVPGATITGLTNGTPYQFRVVSVNSYGTSTASNVVNGTPGAPLNVTWTNTVGVSVNANSITKTATTGWGNSGAVSVATFSGNGGVDFTVAQTLGYVAGGLSNTDYDQSYTSISYGFYLSDGNGEIWESGARKLNGVTYVAGDRFRVERVGTVVYYKKNGTTVYTSTVPSTGMLMVDTAIYTTGATVSDAKTIGFNPGVPDAASNFSAVAASTPGSVLLNWNAPANNGATITLYQVQYGTVASGAFASTFNDDATPGATISGLTNGTAYQFRLVAINSYGASNPSTVQTATPVQKTIVNSDITSNTTWTTTGSPYLITNNINVTSGNTLTINPGVTVMFADSYYLNVAGTLSAVGQLGNPIVFTSGKTVPASRDWQYIALSSSSVLDYVQVEYGDLGLKLTNTSPTISHSILRYNKYGINIVNGSSSSITHNQIIQNDYGLYIAPVSGYTVNPAINFNDIYNNKTYDLYAVSEVDLSAVTINAENNWWGTTNSTTIASRIFDHTDYATSPVVDYNPYATGTDSIAVTATSVSPMFFDPITATASINYTLDKAANVTLRIYRHSNGQLVRTLLNYQSRTSGAKTELWDGKDDAGQLLADDVYYYTIYAQDSQSRFGQYDPVYVPGTVSITGGNGTPITFNPYKGETLPVSFNISQPALVTVKVGDLNSSTITASRILFQNKPYPASTLNLTWDGRDDNGNFVYTNTVFWAYAWTTLMRDNAVVIARTPGSFAVNSVSVDPYAFSPVYHETAQIAYTLSSNATVSVKVKVLNGSLVKTLVDNQAQTSGPHTVTWFGDNASGQKVITQGNYDVWIEATDALGQMVSKRASVTVFK